MCLKLCCSYECLIAISAPPVTVVHVAIKVVRIVEVLFADLAIIVSWRVGVVLYKARVGREITVAGVAVVVRRGAIQVLHKSRIIVEATITRVANMAPVIVNTPNHQS